MKSNRNAMILNLGILENTEVEFWYTSRWPLPVTNISAAGLKYRMSRINEENVPIRGLMRGQKKAYGHSGAIRVPRPAQARNFRITRAIKQGGGQNQLLTEDQS